MYKEQLILSQKVNNYLQRHNLRVDANEIKVSWKKNRFFIFYLSEVSSDIAGAGETADIAFLNFTDQWEAYYNRRTPGAGFLR